MVHPLLRVCVFALSLSVPFAPASADEPSTAPTGPNPPEAEEPAAPVSQAEASPAKDAPDTSELSRELQEVMDELVKARTRASVLAKALFRTRIEVNVLRRADDQQIVHLRLTLDGFPVHDSDGSTIARDEARLFAGHIAPGTHEIGLEITEQAKENATYRYTRSERFRFETRKNQSTRVDLLLRDDSDMAEELPEGDDGTYEVSTKLRVTPLKVRD
jgi:hypothetical protein